MRDAILSILFPRHCILCDEVVSLGEYVCRECKGKLPYIQEPSCKKCGKQLESEDREYCGDCQRKQHNFLQGKAIFSYQKEKKLSMYRFKYSNRREYADVYAKMAVARYGKWLEYRGIEAIVPVPMYESKRRKRGYNQAECFAKSLSRELQIPMESRLIKRVKNTVPQKELNDTQRKDNLKGAFQLQTNIVKYSKILLVDDIYTTGSTMDAVADCLMKAGVAEIYVLSVCIGEGY